MRKRAHRLEFIPDTINFADLEPDRENQFGYEEDHPVIELQICQMIHSLDSDKERCVFFYQLLREYGFNFDYFSCAASLNVQRRWYMRLKQKMQKKLERFNMVTEAT